MESLSKFLKENIRLLLGAIVVIFLALLIISYVLSKQTTKVTVGTTTFNAKIADSEKEREIGLSKTNKLTDKDSMLFLFENSSKYSFWMKDMKFPIDIIFIRDGKVVDVVKNAKPVNANSPLDIYQPEEEADKVLEINAGLSDKLNIVKGTIIKIENL
jgi:uncharacterized membrane protein (UPF0127 family)